MVLAIIRLCKIVVANTNSLHDQMERVETEALSKIVFSKGQKNIVLRFRWKLNFATMMMSNSMEYIF